MGNCTACRLGILQAENIIVAEELWGFFFKCGRITNEKKCSRGNKDLPIAYYRTEDIRCAMEAMKLTMKSVRKFAVDSGRPFTRILEPMTTKVILCYDSVIVVRHVALLSQVKLSDASQLANWMLR